MTVLGGEKRRPVAKQTSEPPLRLLERLGLFFGTALRKGRFSPGKNTKPTGDGSRATEHVKLARDVVQYRSIGLRTPRSFAGMVQFRKQVVIERDHGRKEHTRNDSSDQALMPCANRAALTTA